MRPSVDFTLQMLALALEVSIPDTAFETVMMYVNFFDLLCFVNMLFCGSLALAGTACQKSSVLTLKFVRLF